MNNVTDQFCSETYVHSLQTVNWWTVMTVTTIINVYNFQFMYYTLQVVKLVQMYILQDLRCFVNNIFKSLFEFFVRLNINKMNCWYFLKLYINDWGLMTMVWTYELLIWVLYVTKIWRVCLVPLICNKPLCCATSNVPIYYEYLPLPGSGVDN